MRDVGEDDFLLLGGLVFLSDSRVYRRSLGGDLSFGYVVMWRTSPLCRHVVYW